MVTLNYDANIAGNELQNEDKPNNEEIKSLINKMFDKTIDELKSNENNFYSQRLQLETVTTNLKSHLVDTIIALKENNSSELEALREDNVNLGNKIGEKDELKKEHLPIFGFFKKKEIQTKIMNNVQIKGQLYFLLSVFGNEKEVEFGYFRAKMLLEFLPEITNNYCQKMGIDVQNFK